MAKCAECGCNLSPIPARRSARCSLKWGERAFKFCDLDCLTAWAMTEMGTYERVYGPKHPKSFHPQARILAATGY